ncbi:MAG: hypothetical protein EPO20_03495 [Betaproteobacteria bacterium]|nr:MAG: hypothetical protein EPO20_03495 [Betaproteobacteria bacterium]
MATAILRAANEAAKSVPEARDATLASGSVVAIVAAGLLLQDLVSFHAGARSSLSEPVRAALAGSSLAAVATVLGAFPALFLRQVSQRTEDVMLELLTGQ